LPRITYRPERFGAYWGPAFAQSTTLQFDWEELAKSAVTVGRQGWADVFQYGQFSAFEMTWRLGLLWANLREDDADRVRPTLAFRGLDPSEKGAVSYFMATCFTKLLLEKLCGISWLLHYDMYRKSLNGYLASSHRPDFVGLDAQQQWVIVEAKGRTGSRVSDDTMTKAKRQTRSLRNLNGQLPVLRTAVGVNFTTQLEARVWDPEEYDTDAVDVSIDLESLMRSYYEPLVFRTGLLRTSASVQGQAQKVRRGVLLPASDATLFVDEDIVTAYENEDPVWQKVIILKARTEDSVLGEIAILRETAEQDREAEVSDRLRRLVDARRASNIGHAADGVTVQLGPSWSTANMRREPQNRTR
jgi:hypothetical protein